MARPRIDFSMIFAELQAQMEVTLRGRRRIADQENGDVTEVAWLDWLETYLPRRYSAEPAFVVCAKGQLSDQIDIVIFSRQCAGSILRRNGIAHVPAACVYAIIGVKQTLSLSALREVSSEVLSVRKLASTAASHRQIRLNYKPNTPPRIVGCLIALEGRLGPRHLNFLRNRPERECINIGCSLSGTNFKLDYLAPRAMYSPPYNIKHSQSTNSLVTFLLTLLLELQNVGVVRQLGTTTGLAVR